ncbi:MAG: hypothetical protein QXO51_01650 [Halobacteria archaeon]
MEEPRLDALEHRIRALEARLRAVEGRLSSSLGGAIEGAPPGPGEAPQGADGEALRERLQGLGERVYALEAHAPARMAEALLRVEARLAELERSRAEAAAAPAPPAGGRSRGRGLRLL